jgi:hypothetical protein
MDRLTVGPGVAETIPLDSSKGPFIRFTFCPDTNCASGGQLPTLFPAGPALVYPARRQPSAPLQGTVGSPFGYRLWQIQSKVSVLAGVRGGSRHDFLSALPGLDLPRRAGVKITHARCICRPLMNSDGKLVCPACREQLYTVSLFIVTGFHSHWSFCPPERTASSPG